MDRRPGSVVQRAPAPGRHEEHRLRPSFPRRNRHAQACSLAGCSPAARSARRSRWISRGPNPGRKRKQPPPSGLGQDEHPVPAGRRTNYADGIAKPVGGPSARYVSNRVFNDTSQNLFSENGVTQWGFVWGQFIDHTFGLREEAGRRERADPVQRRRPARELHEHAGLDPVRAHACRARHRNGRTAARADQHGLELHRRLQRLRRDRSAARVAARGTGRRPAVQQRGEAAAARRLPAPCRRPRQRRSGARDGADGPAGGAGAAAKALRRRRRAGQREHRAHGHAHAVRARAQPDRPRAPAPLSEEEKFQIARRVVGAEQQYITYNEFLPALGVRLSPYRGYERQRERRRSRTSSRSSATALTA